MRVTRVFAIVEVCYELWFLWIREGGVIRRENCSKRSGIWRLFGLGTECR
jgi:hypothetical protein